MSRQISPGVAHGYHTRSQRDPRELHTLVVQVPVPYRFGINMKLKLHQATRKLCQGICVTGKPCSNPIAHWRWSGGVRYCIYHKGQQPEESYEEVTVRREDEEYRRSPTKVHRDTDAYKHSLEAYNKRPGEYRLSPAHVRRENERTFRTNKTVAQQDQDFFAEERLLFHHHFHHHGGQVKLRQGKQLAPSPQRHSY